MKGGEKSESQTFPEKNHPDYRRHPQPVEKKGRKKTAIAPIGVLEGEVQFFLSPGEKKRTSCATIGDAPPRKEGKSAVLFRQQ